MSGNPQGFVPRLMEWVLRRYYPGVFMYGGNWDVFSSVEDLDGQEKSGAAICAKYLVGHLMKLEKRHLGVTLSELSDRGEPCGSWILTISKLEPEDD